MWPLILVIYYLNKKSNLRIRTGLDVVSFATLFTLTEYFFPQQFDSFLGSPWIAISKYLSLIHI